MDRPNELFGAITIRNFDTILVPGSRHEQRYDYAMNLLTKEGVFIPNKPCVSAITLEQIDGPFVAIGTLSNYKCYGAEDLFLLPRDNMVLLNNIMELIKFSQYIKNRKLETYLSQIRNNQPMNNFRLPSMIPTPNNFRTLPNNMIQIPTLSNFGSLPTNNFDSLPTNNFGSLPTLNNYGSLPTLNNFGSVPTLNNFGSVPSNNMIPTLNNFRSVPNSNLRSPSNSGIPIPTLRSPSNNFGSLPSLNNFRSVPNSNLRSPSNNFGSLPSLNNMGMFRETNRSYLEPDYDDVYWTDSD